MYSLARVLLSVVFAVSAFAQQSINFATLSGRVEDPAGGIIAGAEIRLQHLARNQSWTTQTDDQGRFRFSYLPVGDYEVRVQHSGFETAVRRIELSIGQSIEVAIGLSLASLNESVSVTGELTGVETVRTQLADTITLKDIGQLPLNGRNYLDLALLTPSVSRTNTGNNERFAETSAVPGTGISVAGQRNLGNSFIVDGLSANDDAADLAGTFYSEEVIREFQVVRSGGIAEFGRASSGIVNVLTESGTNDWRGNIYGFFRNQRFDATNILAPVDPSGKRIRSALTQSQYGATLGGPFKRDRLFSFSNIEREDLHRSGFMAITPPAAAAVNSVLDQVRYPAPRVTTGEYPTGEDRTTIFTRLDYEASQSDRLSGRFSVYDILSPNSRNVGALNTVSRGTQVADRDYVGALNNVKTLSPRSVMETRAQFTRSRFSAPGNDLIGPAVNISGVANFGASTSSPTTRDINAFEIANSYSRLTGSHSFKAGANFLYDRVNIVYPATLYGSYSFSSLANFLTGNYTTFAQAFGKIDWFQTNPNLGLFIQDEWRPRSGVTINGGFRYDVQWLDASIHTQWGNVSPRLAVAFAPGNRKTVVRIGTGLYYDRIPLRAVANAQRGSGAEYKAVSLQRTQAGSPVFPNKLASFPRGALINLATIDPDIKPASGLQANFEIEREVGHGTSLSTGYLYMRGMHIIMQRNLNVPSLTAAQDPVNLGRPNPSFGNITQYSGQGDSYYHGMTVSLQHRASKWVRGRVSYTLSKAIDNSGNFFFSSPQNNFNIRDDRGLSDNDQRHRLTLSGQITMPKSIGAFQLAPIFTYGSPYPFNIVTGGQTIQTTTARPPGIGRNTGRGFDSASFDLRVSRKFPVAERLSIETIAESFNTFNRSNLQFPNNTFGSGTTPLPTFGRATAASDPRQIQFGLRLILP